MAVYKLNESSRKRELRETKYKTPDGANVSPMFVMDAISYKYGIPLNKVVRKDYTEDEIQNAINDYCNDKKMTISDIRSKLTESSHKQHIIWDSEVDMYDEGYMADVKATEYQEYLDELDEDEEPEDFEDWYEGYVDAHRDIEWELANEDLEYNILPEIDKQINNDILLLIGYYGSNYSDFRPSGNGGIMWDRGIDEFRSFLSDFWRVQVTTEDGILGVVCADHDGTISGELFTLPKDTYELARALGYEDEDDLSNALYYGEIDERDLSQHMELLKPIEDTISGYNTDKFKEYRWDKEGLGENFKSRKSNQKRVKRNKKISEARYTGSIYTDEEFQEEVDKILNNHNLEAVNYEAYDDGVAVCVVDRVSGIDFWIDLWINQYGGLEGEWESYIFDTRDFWDAVQSEVQDNAYFYAEVETVAEDYVVERGILRYNDKTDTYSIKGGKDQFKVDDWEN